MRAWQKVRWSVEQRGWPGTLRVLGGRMKRSGSAGATVPPHPFDLEHGVDTGGSIGGGDLAAGHAHDRYISGYTAVAPSRFYASVERWLQTVPGGEVETYTFVDLGCGKGRAVLLASAMPFREVIGVELNPALAAVAEANVRSWRAVRRGAAPMGGRVRVCCGDAVEFALPPGRCLVYLANPFGAPVMQRLLRKLTAREDGVDVIYQNPAEAAVFGEFPEFRLLWDEVIGASEEDTRFDFVYTPTDRCRGYRL